VNLDRRAAGLAALERLGGPDAAAPILAAADVAPDLVRFAIDFAFGEVLSRPGLDVKTRELCTVAALSALGHAAPQLKWHAEAALHVGAQQADVDEVKRMARAYTRPDGGAAGQGPLDAVTRELAAVALLTALGRSRRRSSITSARRWRPAPPARRSSRSSSRWRSMPGFPPRSTAWPPPARSSRRNRVQRVQRVQ